MIDKSKIVYVYEPTSFGRSHYKISVMYLDYIDKYGKMWLKRIVPNIVTYINGKPWYEVKEITEVKSQKDYDANPHPAYTIENRYFCDRETIMKIEDKDWVYRKLLISDLVVISDKNCMYVDNTVEKNGGKWVCTDKFSSHDNTWYHRSPSDSISFTPNEVFDNYADCQCAMNVKELNFQTAHDMSDRDYSLMDACHYLRCKGFSPIQRRDYLKEMAKLNNVESVVLFVRDGKVYAGNQPDDRKPVPYPEYTEEIKRSPKKHRDWVDECKRIDYENNWFIGKKELTI